MSGITEQKIRAAEFMTATELALAGSLSMFKATLWRGDEEAIAIARQSVKDSFSMHIEALEAQLLAQRADLRALMRKGGGK